MQQGAKSATIPARNEASMLPPKRAVVICDVGRSGRLRSSSDCNYEPVVILSPESRGPAERPQEALYAGKLLSCSSTNSEEEAVVLGAAGGIYLLALLACPISMGLMMVFMGRGMIGGQKRASTRVPNEGESVEALKEEQARLAERIAALDAGGTASTEMHVPALDEQQVPATEDREPERTPTAAA